MSEQTGGLVLEVGVVEEVLDWVTGEDELDWVTDEEPDWEVLDFVVDFVLDFVVDWVVLIFDVVALVVTLVLICETGSNAIGIPPSTIWKSKAKGSP